MWPLREKHRALVENALSEGKLEMRCAVCKRSAENKEVFKKATSIEGGYKIGECLDCWRSPLCFDCSTTSYVTLKNEHWRSTYSLVGVRCLKCVCRKTYFKPLMCALCGKDSPHREVIPPLEKIYYDKNAAHDDANVKEYAYTTIFAPLSEGNEPGTHGTKRTNTCPDMRGSVPCDGCGTGPLCGDCYVGRHCAGVYCVFCAKDREEKKISDEKSEIAIEKNVSIACSKRKLQETEGSSKWEFLRERSQKNIKQSEDEVAEREQFVGRLRERISKLPRGEKSLSEKPSNHIK